MNHKLNQIQDWQARARQTEWSVAELAKRCNVSVRTLERHFVKEMGKSPKTWMMEQRQQQAAEPLQAGSSVKETASNLGYKHSTHLSRDFKEHWGICPTQFNPNQPEA
jgi:AraC family transcriptional activator FtrA